MTAEFSGETPVVPDAYQIPRRVARRAPVAKSDIPSSSPSEPANVIFGEIAPSIFLGLLRNIRRNYRYRRLGSRAILFRCQDDLYSRHAIDGRMGWGRLFTRGIEIVETPGDHSSLLQDPHLKALAERIDYQLKQLGPQKSRSSGTSRDTVEVFALSPMEIRG